MASGQRRCNPLHREIGQIGARAGSWASRRRDRGGRSASGSLAAGEQHDAGAADGGGEVHRAGVVADGQPARGRRRGDVGDAVRPVRSIAPDSAATIRPAAGASRLAAEDDRGESASGRAAAPAPRTARPASACPGRCGARPAPAGGEGGREPRAPARQPGQVGRREIVMPAIASCSRWRSRVCMRSRRGIGVRMRAAAARCRTRAAGPRDGNSGTERAEVCRS